MVAVMNDWQQGGSGSGRLELSTSSTPRRSSVATFSSEMRADIDTDEILAKVGAGMTTARNRKCALPAAMW